ncbi:MAG: cobyrinate a,c-diamide synthase [Pikeienuella sp.]
MTKALMISAPTSGAGKTVATLALLRALRDRGIDVRAGKSGPDYIDPQFHRAATGTPSVNLDAWAMDADALRARAAGQGGDLLVVEGAVGLLDGAGVAGNGSAADLAHALGASVVLVVDVARHAHSAVLPLAGARALRPDLDIAGVILNRVGSPRHEAMARGAVERAGFTCFGALPRDEAFTTPSRHLGLVQATERDDIEAFIERAAQIVANRIDLEALAATALPLPRAQTGRISLSPLGSRIAVASDVAFAFAYPHMLNDWHEAGAEVTFFSPLADEAPDATSDAVFLPGGYPELHAGPLSAATNFQAGMKAHTGLIYGECGGYMTLGEGLIDADGHRHEMLGLLPLTTSFAERKLTLGYRRLVPLGGPFTAPLMAHEFHYATIKEERGADRLFAARDADGTVLPDMGMRLGHAFGSFAHIICQP